ncbi:Tn3 family transposase [Streptomyces sp. NPDC059455]|uniref:Tn3 family transposase n=1 Tax=Streptomyces sp. NPDC059455 TaxID=3346837 RepID=UPI00367855EE
MRHRGSQWVPVTYTVTQEDGTEKTKTVAADFASQMWQRILFDKHKPGKINRRHFEVCTLFYLTQELRTGDVAVIGSQSYANLHDQLLSWQACEPLAADYCEQAGLPSTAPAFTAALKQKLTQVAAKVDAGYPDNADLTIDTASGKIVLTPRKGKDRRKSAQDLEAEILRRLPEWSLLDVLARTAYWIQWWRHFGPASGSDPKIRDKLARYVLAVFCYGTNAGPAQVARHMRQKVSVHELSLAGNQHITAEKLNAASADVIDMFIQLDLAHVWGDVGKAGIDGSQYDTWENNMLAESHIRYGGFGGISMRHVSDTYIALFSHFIPCGVWEAVYLFEGLLKNQSEVTVDIVHGDTQGQSLPVFGLAHMLGVELLPRIRSWKDLTFYRPSPTVTYQHIDPLFGDPEKDVINWRLIENHWQDLMRVVLSIREGRLSSAALLRRLGNESKRNRIYQAYRELGRVMRTIVLLRFLSEPELRESIQAMTNKVEAFHKFSNWLMFASDVLQDNDPDHQEKAIKFNELLANCLIVHTAVDITKVANDLIEEGWEVDPVDLATVTPYITSKTRRFGTWHLGHGAARERSGGAAADGRLTSSSRRAGFPSRRRHLTAGPTSPIRPSSTQATAPKCGSHPAREFDMCACAPSVLLHTVSDANDQGLTGRGMLIETAFSTRDVLAPDRFSCWREHISQTYVPMDVEGDRTADTTVSQRILALGAVQLWTMEHSPMTLRRTQKLIQQSDPELYHLSLNLRGTMELTSPGHEAEYEPYDLVLHDTSRPHLIRATTSHGEDTILGTGLFIPRKLLPLPEKAIDSLIMRRLSGREGIAALLAQFLTQVTRDSSFYRPDDGPRLGTVAVDLLSALFARALDAGDSLPPESHQQALVLRIRAFIQANLHDPQLTPPAIAAAHHISTSYLHRLFQHEEETVTASIRRQHLERASHDLADPTQRTTPIHTIAARWGFPRAADFTRAYGMPPKDYRNHSKRHCRVDCC